MITLDAGNTSIKCVVWDEAGNPGPIIRIQKNDDIESILQTCVTSDRRVVLSSVRSEKDTQQLLDSLCSIGTIKQFHSGLSMPFPVDYHPRESLGPDRLLAVLGLHYKFPRHDALVVDCGTCVKYGFMSAEKGFIGGFISPGMNMRYHALHGGTGRLPLFSSVEPITDFNPGTSTKASVQGGVEQGIYAEILFFIKRSWERLKNPVVVFTGGDAERFMKILFAQEFKEDNLMKNKIFAEPYLLHTALKNYFNGQ